MSFPVWGSGATLKTFDIGRPCFLGWGGGGGGIQRLGREAGRIFYSQLNFKRGEVKFHIFSVK